MIHVPTPRRRRRLDMARRTTLSPVLVAIVLVPVLTACETTGSSSLFALAPEVGSERSQKDLP